MTGHKMTCVADHKRKWPHNDDGKLLWWQTTTITGVYIGTVTVQLCCHVKLVFFITANQFKILCDFYDNTRGNDNWIFFIMRFRSIPVFKFPYYRTKNYVYILSSGNVNNGVRSDEKLINYLVLWLTYVSNDMQWIPQTCAPFKTCNIFMCFVVLSTDPYPADVDPCPWMYTPTKGLIYMVCLGLGYG